MRHTHHFEFGQIILSPLEASDLEHLRILRNKLSDCFLTGHQIDSESQQRWYDNYLKKNDDIMFTVSHRDAPGAFIGAIAVYDIDPGIKTAEFGRAMIDKEKNDSPGTGLDATRGICLFSFVVLGMEQVIARVLKTNERALHTYRRAGFRVIGDFNKDTYEMAVTRDILLLYG